MTIHLGYLLPNISSDLPELRCGKHLSYMTSIYKCSPYLVLLPTGFTMPNLLPNSRCALTAPSHLFLLCHEGNRGSLIFCSTSRKGKKPFLNVIQRRLSVKPRLSSPYKYAAVIRFLRHGKDTQHIYKINYYEALLRLAN